MEDSNRIEDEQIGRVDFTALPEGCVANILSLTTPPDAGRLASVSPTFRLAADSDAVWDRFLPSDYQSIISRSGSDPAVFSRKKDLFRSLCQNPILIDDGTKSFSLDKQSGKKCFMLAARGLKIVWGDTSQYWGWTSLPESQFAEVAQLFNVCWLEIRGKISTRMLSPATTYGAYLVFKMPKGAFGFGQCAVKVSVGTTVGESHEQTVCLKPAKERPENQVAQSGMIGSSSLVHNESDEYGNSDHDEPDEYGNSDNDDTDECGNSEHDETDEYGNSEHDVTDEYDNSEHDEMDEYDNSNHDERAEYDVPIHLELDGYSDPADEWEVYSEYEDGVEGLQRPKERRDGWLEVELGEVFNGEGDDGDMEMSIMETVSGNWKGGLIVEGIEVRPK